MLSDFSEASCSSMHASFFFAIVYVMHSPAELQQLSIPSRHPVQPQREWGQALVSDAQIHKFNVSTVIWRRTCQRSPGSYRKHLICLPESQQLCQSLAGLLKFPGARMPHATKFHTSVMSAAILLTANQ